MTASRHAVAVLETRFYRYLKLPLPLLDGLSVVCQLQGYEPRACAVRALTLVSLCSLASRVSMR